MSEMELTQEQEDFIVHFGVLGMRWGQRRARNTGAAMRKDQARLKKASSSLEKASGVVGKQAAKKEAKATALAKKIKAKQDKIQKELDAEVIEGVTAKDINRAKTAKKAVAAVVTVWAAKQVFDVIRFKKLGLI